MDARQSIQRIGCTILIVIGMAAAADGRAANVTVRCGGGGEDAFPSISAALAHLDPRGTNTIAVYGACHENLSITDFNHLTLNANAGASISDASGATDNVILITSSQTVALNGFTINGAVLCQISSFCGFTGNTFQNARGGGAPHGGALSDGVYIRAASHASFSGDKLVNNARFGMTVTGGSFAEATAITASGNGTGGIFLAVGPTVLLNNVTIANNGYFGVWVRDHSSLFITDSEVTGNGGTGVSVESSSEAWLYASVTGNVITGNGNYGVLVADLSLANSSDGATGNTISGNSAQPDVQCVGKSSAAIGLPLKAGTMSATCGP